MSVRFAGDITRSENNKKNIIQFTGWDSFFVVDNFNKITIWDWFFSDGSFFIIFVVLLLEPLIGPSYVFFIIQSIRGSVRSQVVLNDWAIFSLDVLIKFVLIKQKECTINTVTKAWNVCLCVCEGGWWECVNYKEQCKSDDWCQISVKNPKIL